MNEQIQQFDTDGGRVATPLVTRENAMSAIRSGTDAFGTAFGGALGVAAAGVLIKTLAFAAMAIAAACSSTRDRKSD